MSATQFSRSDDDRIPSSIVNEISIQLPKVEIFESLSYPIKYGATHVAAAYCGFKSPPRAHRGDWQHGWSPKHFQFDPSMLVGHPTLNPSHHYWLARGDEEIYFRSQGYKNVKAIGLPILYLASNKLVRRPKSLLVMPAHSLDYTTLKSGFKEYVETIASIRSKFSEVVICVHPACWRNGYWVDAFKKRGFKVIKGAFIEDRNALDRMSRLFSTFEYVTTNGLGSHIAYAAYFGAKVSIFGCYLEYRSQDFINDPLYREKPYLLDPTIRANSEQVMREHYPELFCHPMQAKQRLEWGHLQLGSDNKVTPDEMRYLFGWTMPSRVAYKLRDGTPKRVKHWAKLLIRPEYRRIEKELQRLSKMPRFTLGYTNVLGKRFEFRDAVSFVQQYHEIFEQQIFRFPAADECPLIIDTTVNAGLSAVYFKRLYSDSRIIGFEPDPDTYKVLTKNCQTFNLLDVEVFSKAIGASSTVVKLQRGGSTPDECDEDFDVPALRLKEFLYAKVDLLKLEIKGSKTEVLRDCDSVLQNVNNVVVFYRSSPREPQAIDVVTRILKDAGFRLHIYGEPKSRHPFLWRKVGWGTDMELKIFAFRE